MPKLLCARQPLDAREKRQVRKLATSPHAPADWIFHAQLIVRSWDGQRTSAIANRGEIALAVRVATFQLNARARPWIWGRPPPPHRQFPRRFVYSL